MEKTKEGFERVFLGFSFCWSAWRARYLPHWARRCMADNEWTAGTPQTNKKLETTEEQLSQFVEQKRKGRTQLAGCVPHRSSS